MSEIHHIEENMPHKTSEVVCLWCLKRWIAVRPCARKLKDLECPQCGKQGYVIETGEKGYVIGTREIIDTEDYA